MARVTIEDCLEKVYDRFELVALAAQRAKDINAGSDLNIDRNGEKDTVIALREIADEKVNVDILREEVISSYQLEKNIEARANFSDDDILDDISVDEEDLDIKEAIMRAEEFKDSYNQEIELEEPEELSEIIEHALPDEDEEDL